MNDTEKYAELFHDTYETLAPAYGYETREDTKVFDPNSKNGKLMIAVTKFVLLQGEKDMAEWIEKMRISWEWSKGHCFVCNYMEHSGETHQCEIYNQALEDILSSLKQK